MNDLRFVIAKNLAFLRKRNNYTQAELATKINYSDKAVSKWETGETEPSVDVLKDIADFYGITLDEIVDPKLNETKPTTNKQHRYSRRVISLLAILTVWLIATMGFSLSLIYNPDSSKNAWLLFIFALPISFIIAIVFNALWGKSKLTFVYISCLVWTAILSFYLSFFVLAGFNTWPIFFIGIPAQVIIFLWANIKKKDAKK